jgi:hypothetical protein
VQRLGARGAGTLSDLAAALGQRGEDRRLVEHLGGHAHARHA